MPRRPKKVFPIEARVIVRFPSKNGDSFSNGVVTRKAHAGDADIMVKTPGAPFPMSYPKSRVRLDVVPDLAERWKMSGEQMS